CPDHRGKPRDHLRALSERRARRCAGRRFWGAAGAQPVRRARALFRTHGRWGARPAGAVVAPDQVGCRPRARALRDRMPQRRAAAGAAAPAWPGVVPVRNEAGNVGPLADEIAAALTGRWSFEIIFVNDGSTDATAAELTTLAAERAWLRQVTHATSCGQSAAV